MITHTRTLTACVQGCTMPGNRSGKEKAMIGNDVLDEIRALVGARHVLSSKEELLCYSYDPSPVIAMPDAVVFPGSTEEVAGVLRIANRGRIPVVPRGAGSNLCGGVIPTRGGIVLLSQRMNRILEIDRRNLTATVQPGVVLADLHAAVEKLGLFYPPDPASLAISTLGGNIAEGSGGPRAVKYGTTKDYVLGLEVVLASGDVIRTGGKTVKNVSGYDLTHLFVGSEGTLGFVTEIIVRLIPLPEDRHTLLAVFDRLEDAAEAVADIIAARVVPATIEIMDRICMKRVEAYKPTGLPVDAEAILLIEVDGSEQEVVRQGALVETLVLAHHGRELQAARNPADRDRLWVARRAAFAALASAKPSMASEDATVPREKVPEMVRTLHRLAKEHGLELGLMGHIGDGNLHPIVMTDERDTDEWHRVEGFYDEVFKAALQMGGTLTGEHGIGLNKRRFMKAQFGDAGVEVMRRIKRAMDPNDIMNPGKMLPDE